MISLDFLRGKPFAVFGLSTSGQAVLEALSAAGVPTYADDDSIETRRKIESMQISRVEIVNLRQFDFSTVHALILSPGVPLTHPKPHWVVERAKAFNLPIIGDMELFAQARAERGKKDKVICVTGTNGKSTTTALISHVLSRLGFDNALGGNIGQAVLSLPDFSDGFTYVLECSSFQIELAPSLEADVGILLNLSVDHLDRHGTMEHYRDIKQSLMMASKSAIVGEDDEYCQRIAEHLRARQKKVIPISGFKPNPYGYHHHQNTIIAGQKTPSPGLIDYSGTISLMGQHNGQNVAAAVACITEMGCFSPNVAKEIKSYPGLRHRMEWVADVNGIRFINDSKATNAESAYHALRAFRNIYWIAGGKPKEGGIKSLVDTLEHVQKVYLIGEAAEDFAKTLKPLKPFELSTTLERAVQDAYKDAVMNLVQDMPVILLSPACASYDQFKNFEHRGQEFCQLVQELKQKLEKVS